jgi:elongation factor Ts
VRRIATVETDGVLGAYSHGGRIGVLVALKGGSEELAKGIAMHVAAMNPKFIKVEDVPADFLEKEKEIELSKMSDKEKQKPAEILEKIVSGKVNKILADVTLVGQSYVIDTEITVADALKKGGAEIIAVERLAVGEGIEKVVDDFAAEVMKQAGLA